MALTVLTPPASLLLSTLDRARRELGLSGSDGTSDQILFDLLTDASDAIARECARTFGVQTQTETLKGTGSQILGLANAPILAVTSVLMDTDLVDPTDPDQGYRIEDAEAGALYRPCGWGQTVATLAWGASAYSSMYILPGGTNTLRYTVTYTSGFLLPMGLDDRTLHPVSLPGDIERACLQTVKAWWYTRDVNPLITSVQTADQKVTYDLAASYGQIPLGAMRLLRNYRRVVA